MKTKEEISRARQAVYDMTNVFARELRNIVHDEGAILFFIVVPLFYPLLYTWLYNKEIVKEVPIAVVDDSRGFLSRELIRHIDASEGIKVTGTLNSIGEARRAQAQQQCHGIIYIPSDFDVKINRGEQTVVTFFADLSSMMYYKSALSSLTDVVLDMGRAIQVKTLNASTERDEEVGTMPLNVKSVQLFNPQGGYASFLIPAVLMLIIQQTLLLGIGLLAGTARETNRFYDLVPVKRHENGMFRIIFGKSLCYFAVYLVISTYVLGVVPKLFHLLELGHLQTIIAFVIPYLLACIFFGMMISGLVRFRENVILLIVFTSVPLLFLTGLSWPTSNTSGIWRGVSFIFPSTFGVNAYIKVNSMGASLEDISFEYHMLYLQALLYFFAAVFVYWRQINLSRHRALVRMNNIRQAAIPKDETD